MNSPSQFGKSATPVNTIGLIFLLTFLNQPVFAFEPTDGCRAASVSEFGDYTVVYKLAMSDNADYSASDPVYEIDNSANVLSFDKVAYCMELDVGGNLRWVWVSMDAFATSAVDLGVPVVSGGNAFQRTVEGMSVTSNVLGVTTGPNIATGNIEFWPHSYVAAAGLGLPAASSLLLDFDDTPGIAGDFGSMQIHNYGAAETIIAFNGWSSAVAIDDIGIGTNGGMHPDWSNEGNAASYVGRKDLYVLVREQQVSTVAGSGMDGDSGDGGPATVAAMSAPEGIAVDAAGNIYIADSQNNRIRKVDTNGTISTFGGTNTVGFSGDGGLATAAQIDEPVGLDIDDAGNIYFVDRGNKRIRKIDTAGIITTIAGTGGQTFNGDGIMATAANIRDPRAVTVDNNGVVYISDVGNDIVRKVDAAGIITTVAGLLGAPGYNGDGILANSASINRVFGIYADDLGNLFISDSSNHRVRMIDTAGVITTVAGIGQSGSNGDGGLANLAKLKSPRGLFGDAKGNLYIAEFNGHRIRGVDTSGVIRTIAGTGLGGFNGDGGAPTMTEFNSPIDVVIDGDGAFYVSDRNNNRIRKISVKTGNSAPTDITLDNDFVSSMAGPDALVGTLTTLDADLADSHVYSLVAGTGDTDNALFSIVGAELRVLDPSMMNGVFSVRIQTDDQSGGTFVEAFAITVGIPDTVAPVIVLSGSNPQLILLGTAYTELGATATDDVDGDLSAAIVIDAGTVDINTEGDYTVTYNVSDLAGNAAVTVTRTVTVLVDTTPPTITLTGANPLVITTGTAYAELGATAVDNVDGDISTSIVIDASAVDTAVVGSYSVTYDVADASGNAAATVTRTVTVNAPFVPPPPPVSSGGGSTGGFGVLFLASLLAWRRRKTG